MIPYVLVVILHVLVALFLIVVILLQGGRGGLGEALGGAAAQSLFGGGVNTVMTKITGVCAGLFMVTSLSLAVLSTARGRSVMEQLRQVSPVQTKPVPSPATQPTQASALPPAAEPAQTPQSPQVSEPPPTAPATPASDPAEPAGTTAAPATPASEPTEPVGPTTAPATQ